MHSVGRIAGRRIALDGHDVCVLDQRPETRAAEVVLVPEDRPLGARESKGTLAIGTQPNSGSAKLISSTDRLVRGATVILLTLASDVDDVT